MGTFYEFFAGGGMASLGLGPEWACLFANDIDVKKSSSFRENHPEVHFVEGDIANITLSALPSYADLVWASSPCQDFSLAGNGNGLAGNRSGTFVHFWNLVEELIEDRRAPKIVAFENVLGLLSSNQGRDFEMVCRRFHESGYQFAPLIVDARLFLPQSRPRLFVIGIRKNLDYSNHLASIPSKFWHGDRLTRAYARLPKEIAQSWSWISPKQPPIPNEDLAAIVESNPIGVKWHTAAQTAHLISLMDQNHFEAVEGRRKSGEKFVGAIYRRMRPDGLGGKVQRAEVRFDGLAGCLRTPAGGSSRQTLLFVDGKKTKSRLLSPREAARLMGLPDSYCLPSNYNDAYQLIGDGVAVPAVRFLKNEIFNPIISSNLSTKAA